MRSEDWRAVGQRNVNETKKWTFGGKVQEWTDRERVINLKSNLQWEISWKDSGRLDFIRVGKWEYKILVKKKKCSIFNRRY